MGIPVQFQLVVNCHPFEYHLFAMDYVLPVVFPGLKLTNIPGMPNVCGPAAEFDNQVVNVCYDGKTASLYCQVYGVRHATETLAEVQALLPEWQHVRKIENVGDTDAAVG